MLPAAHAQKRFEESIEVVTVEVPVQVVSKGRPVRGLDVSSFQLFADGKRQKITGFEVVDLDQIEGIEAMEALPLPARRHFLFLFDLSFSQPDGVVRSQQAARRLVADGLHPTDLAAVATYSLNQGAELVLGFTPDRGQLETALDQLGLQQYGDRLIDPLGLMVAVDPIVRGSTDPALDGGGGGGVVGQNFRERLIRQHYADLSIATQRVTRELQIDRAQKYSASMEELAGWLGAVRGRKQIVLFSEGFDASSILGTDSRERVYAAAQAAERGEYWKIDSDERFGSSSTLSFLERMLSAFRNSDAAIQAVDVGGARVAGRAEATRGAVGTASVTGGGEGFRSIAENSLFVMANETGGELYRNFNDLNEAMEQLLDRSSVTYLLSFEPKKLPPDGAFHRINVKLKDAPRGARAVHKTGFSAPTPYRDQSKLIRQLQAADLVLDSRDGGDFDSQVWATPGANIERLDGGEPLRTVLVSLAVDGEQLLALQESDLARFRVFVYATRDDGTIVDFMTQALDLDLDRVEDAIAAHGLHFFGELHLPAGSFRIRTVFQDARTGRHATRTRRVRTPADGDPHLALTPPLFPQSSETGLLLLENDSRRALGGYPFADDAAESAWLPRETLTIDAANARILPIAAYARAGDGTVAEAWLETEAGQRLDVPVTQREPRNRRADGWLEMRFEVDTRVLDPGTYRIQLSLADGELRASRAGTLVVRDR